MNRPLVWAALALASCLNTHAAPAQPNIVVLVADDWGMTDVGAFGGEIATPHIDQLAANGVRFSNFHVAASCAPTRSMLLTGVENHRNGVGNLRETLPRAHRGQPGYQGSLTQGVVTVSSLLRDAGYRTYIAGKWNVGSEPYNLPPQRGFERSIIQGDTGSDNWDPQQRYLPHSATVQWFEDGKPATMPQQFYSSTYFVDRAIGYLRQDANDRRPFFAYVGFQANHVPLQAPQAFVDKYKGRYKDGWDVLREERRKQAAKLGLIPPDTPMVRMNSTKDWNALSAQERAYQERLMEVYAGMADAMDHEVGRLVQYLKDSDQYDDTVFVFLSDNGPEGSDYADAQLWLTTQYTQEKDRLGGPGAYAIMGPSWASAAAAPFSSYKFYSGEGGLRSPLIIAGARGAKAGSVVQALTHVTDITPTLLALAGVPPPQGQYKGQNVEPIAGTSLVPLLTAQATTVRGAEQPLGYELSGNRALFLGDYKLVSNMPPVGDGAWHLFNIKTDPGETLDLKDKEAERFAAMQKDYEAFAQSHGVLPMPAGYTPTRAVLINSMVNYWLPTYWLHIVLGNLTLVALVVTWWRKRRRAA